ncbi:gastrula zinc finger protein XlCGF66.1 [Bombina bombina]|uniref:gastrula zinc finger protein XlCGF66.1 n=1 Tax=Bombina bombina TaxID=8345 RepID=UPI00235B1D43|nr:gastrula zinc finger protein XlCGF66.1 [Bombina bombina]
MMITEKKMNERILDHALEIIYLLTGEVSALRHLTKSLILNSDKKMTKRIIHHSLQIISLLTGEVAIKCDDVAVYFTMEEWDYIEGHKEMYKDVINKCHQTLRTLEFPACKRSGDEADVCVRRQQKALKQETFDLISTSGSLLFLTTLLNWEIGSACFRAGG